MILPCLGLLIEKGGECGTYHRTGNEAMWVLCLGLTEWPLRLAKRQVGVRTQ